MLQKTVRNHTISVYTAYPNNAKRMYKVLVYFLLVTIYNIDI